MALSLRSFFKYPFEREPLVYSFQQSDCASGTFDILWAIAIPYLVFQYMAEFEQHVAFSIRIVPNAGVVFYLYILSRFLSEAFRIQRKESQPFS